MITLGVVLDANILIHQTNSTNMIIMRNLQDFTGSPVLAQAPEKILVHYNQHQEFF